MCARALARGLATFRGRARRWADAWRSAVVAARPSNDLEKLPVPVPAPGWPEWPFRLAHEACLSVDGGGLLREILRHGDGFSAVSRFFFSNRY